MIMSRQSMRARATVAEGTPSYTVRSAGSVGLLSTNRR